MIQTNIVKYLHLFLYADKNFPVGPPIRMTAEQAGLDRIGDIAVLVRKAKKLNPALELHDVLTAMMRAGAASVVAQIENGKLGKFLLNQQ